MKRTAKISDYLKPIGEVPIQSYLTNSLQVADVLDWVLSQVGKAEVWQTSFSISEEFLRRLFFLKQRRDVSRFHLVLDHKATNKTLKLWVFIDKVIADTFLADNHSKILLVKADNGTCVSIITSQNLTRGNRNESALVTTDKGVFDTLLSQVTDLIENHSVPISKLIRKRIEGDLSDETVQ